MPEKLMITAPAKVNLSLRITGRRDDGYHELESLVAFASCGDTLQLAKASATRLTVEGSGVVPADETNLIIRALRSLEAHTGKPLVTDIRLHKNLPVAGGLGGGSADAAAVLNGLTRLFELDVSEVPCAGLARALGADVPACLAPGPGWMTGTGDGYCAPRQPAGGGYHSGQSPHCLAHRHGVCRPELPHQATGATDSAAGCGGL